MPVNDLLNLIDASLSSAALTTSAAKPASSTAATADSRADFARRLREPQSERPEAKTVVEPPEDPRPRHETSQRQSSSTPPAENSRPRDQISTTDANAEPAESTSVVHHDDPHRPQTSRQPGDSNANQSAQYATATSPTDNGADEPVTRAPEDPTAGTSPNAPETSVSASSENAASGDSTLRLVDGPTVSPPYGIGALLAVYRPGVSLSESGQLHSSSGSLEQPREDEQPLPPAILFELLGIYPDSDVAGVQDSSQQGAAFQAAGLIVEAVRPSTEPAPVVETPDAIPLDASSSPDDPVETRNVDGTTLTASINLLDGANAGKADVEEVTANGDTPPVETPASGESIVGVSETATTANELGRKPNPDDSDAGTNTAADPISALLESDQALRQSTVPSDDAPEDVPANAPRQNGENSSSQLSFRNDATSSSNTQILSATATSAVPIESEDQDAHPSPVKGASETKPVPSKPKAASIYGDAPLLDQSQIGLPVPAIELSSAAESERQDTGTRAMSIEAGSDKAAAASPGRAIDVAPSGQQASDVPVAGLAGNRHVAQPRGTTDPSAETPRIQAEQIIDRLSSAVRQMQPDGRPLRVLLHPPELGTVHIEVHVHEGQLSARMEMETASAQRIVLEHMSQLRESLLRHGMHLERIDVHVAESPAHHGEYSSGSGFDQQQNESGQEQGGQPRQNYPESSQQPQDGDDEVTAPLRTAAGSISQLDIEV